MNLHEYQGKELISRFGVRIQQGIAAKTVDEAVAAAKKLHEDTGTSILGGEGPDHAGGRGKTGVSKWRNHSKK